MKKWSERSEETAYLLNPPFLSLVIQNAIDGYMTMDDDGSPFILPFILVPLVLHGRTRRMLPRTTRTTFASWITDTTNAVVKLDFAVLCRALNPYVKEGLIFSMQNGGVRISEHGRLVVSGAVKKSFAGASEEVDACIRASAFCGKWFGKSGSIKTTLALLGVKP